MRDTLLDPLRGVAAVWVLLHHIAHFSATDPAAVPTVFRLGYFGVPLFFVVSGYCLAAAGRRAVRIGEPPSRFLARRALRIFPPFGAAVVVSAAALAALPLFGSPVTSAEAAARARFATSAPADWFPVATLTAGFRPTGELPWHKFQLANLAFWTLAIELQFYAVVGLAVRCGRRFYPVLLGATLVSLPFVLDGAAFRGGTFLAGWPVFALGVGLYRIRELGWRPRSSGVRAGATLVGLAAMAGGLTIAPLDPDGRPAMLGGEFLFAAGLTAVLAATGRATVERPAGAVLGYLGTVSYSIYLLHVPLFFLLAHPVAAIASPGGPIFLAIVAILIAAGVYPFHRFVERPFTSGAPSAPPRETSENRGIVRIAVPGAVAAR